MPMIGDAVVLACALGAAAAIIWSFG